VSDAIERHVDEANNIRSRCHDGALYAYGTSYVFQRRARILGQRLNILTYIGFLVPVVVGGLVLSYGHFKSLPTVIAIASAFVLVQTVVSLWSVIGGWVAGYSYATTSAADNARLAQKYEDLAKSPSVDLTLYRHEFEKLRIRDEARQEQDYQQAVSETEKRRGLRAAFRQCERECPGCNKQPFSMESTDCDVCGNFNHRLMRKGKTLWNWMPTVYLCCSISLTTGSRQKPSG
jgi:mobilome CxxCx(11)CxxC protein